MSGWPRFDVKGAIKNKAEAVGRAVSYLVPGSSAAAHPRPPVDVKCEEITTLVGTNLVSRMLGDTAGCGVARDRGFTRALTAMLDEFAALNGGGGAGGTAAGGTEEERAGRVRRCSEALEACVKRVCYGGMRSAVFMHNFPVMIYLWLRFHQFLEGLKGPMIAPIRKQLDDAIQKVDIDIFVVQEATRQENFITQILQSLLQVNREFYLNLTALRRISISKSVTEETKVFFVNVHLLLLQMEIVSSSLETDEHIQTWKLFIADLLGRLSFSANVNFFDSAQTHRPFLFASVVASHYGPSVSIAVIEGITQMVTNPHCRIASEPRAKHLPFTLYWACPTTFSIPKTTAAIVELSRAYDNLMNLACPSRIGERIPPEAASPVVEYLANWWYIHKFVVPKLCEEPGQKALMTNSLAKLSCQCGIAPLFKCKPFQEPSVKAFLEQSLKTFLDNMSETDSPLSILDFTRIPEQLVSFDNVTKFLQQINETSVTEVANLFDICTRKIPPNVDLQFALAPFTQRLKDRTLESIIELFKILLKCKSYFLVHDNPSHVAAVKTALKVYMPLEDFHLEQFEMLVEQLHICEKGNLSEMYLVFIKALSSLIVSSQVETEAPLPAQLNQLGSFLFPTIDRWTSGVVYYSGSSVHSPDKVSPQLKSALLVAVLGECLEVRTLLDESCICLLSPPVLSLLVLHNVEMNNVFYPSYHDACTKLVEKIKAAIDCLHDKYITRQKLNVLSEPSQPQTSFANLIYMQQKLFPATSIPTLQELITEFNDAELQTEQIKRVWLWLLQRARLQLPTVSDVDAKSDPLAVIQRYVDGCKSHLHSLGFPDVFDALNYFLEKKSTYFDALIVPKIRKCYTNAVPLDQGQQLARLISATLGDLRKFISGSVCLDQIKQLDKSGASNPVDEGAILTDWFEKHSVGLFEPMAYDRQILNDARELVNYLENIPAVCECCHQWKISKGSRKLLQNELHLLTSENFMSREECSGKLRFLQQQLGEMTPSQMLVFKSFSLIEDVLDWYRTFKSDKDFQDKEDFVRADTQGWKFGQDLSNCVARVRPAIVTFQQVLDLPNRKSIPLRELCVSLVRTMGPVGEFQKNLDAIHENLPRIKVLFTQSKGLNPDALLPYINQLRQNGRYKSSLSLHRKGESLVLLQDQKEESRSYLINLMRAMKIFIDSSEKGAETNISEFIQLFNCAEEIHQGRLRLEALGHPNFQGSEDFLNDVGELNSVEKLTATSIEIRNTLNEWKGAIEALHEEPRLNFLSGRQLTQFGATLSMVTDPGLGQDFVASQVASYVWYCFPERTISAHTSYQCVCTALSLMGGVPTGGWTPLSTLTLVHQFVKELAQHSNPGPNSPETANDISIVLAEKFSPHGILFLLFELFHLTRPHPSLILYARTASHNDLERFLKCVTLFPHLMFALVGVNEMPEDMRKVLYKWVNEVTTGTLEGKEGNNKLSNNYGKMVLIFTERVGIDIFMSFDTKYQENVLPDVFARLETSNELSLQALCRNSLHVQCYTGKERSGKTTEIRHKMDLQKTPNTRNLFLAIQEGFSLSNLLNSLEIIEKWARELEGECQVNVHFDISAYANLPPVAILFFNLVVWRTVCDPSTGRIFHLPCATKTSFCKWTLFVEVSAAPKSDALEGFGQETTEKVLEHIPILWYLCHCRIPEDSQIQVSNCTLPFIVDENALLVAKCLHFCSDLFAEASLPQFLDSVEAVPAFDFNQELAHFFSLKKDMNDIQRQKHFVELLSERCQWIVQQARERVKSSVTGVHQPPQFTLQILFNFLVEECYKLCRRTLDSEKQFYVTRESPSAAHHRVKIDELSTSPPPAILAFMARRKFQPPKKMDIIDTEIENLNTRLMKELGLTFGVKDLKSILDKQHYVLTPDFALKLLLVYDHMLAKQNLTLCGGTGTGKSELMRVFCEIVNSHSQLVPDMARKIHRFLFYKLPIKVLSQAEVERFRPHCTDHTMAAAKFTEVVSEMCHLLKEGQPVLPLVVNATVEYIKEKLGSKKYLCKTDPLVKLLSAAAPQAISEVDFLQGLLDCRNAKFNSFFHRIKMHQRITADEFRNHIQQAVTAAENLPSKARIVFFIDECTSTSLLGMVKEVLCDHRLDGAPLPTQIFFVAALNQNRDEDSSASSPSSFVPISFEGVDHGMIQSFAVRPPPLSLKKLLVDFGKLNMQQERSFTAGLIESRLMRTNLSEHDKHLTHLILMAQDFVNKAHIPRVTASIRDIMRAVDLYSYFSGHTRFMHELPSESKERKNLEHWQALALSIAMTYYFRLPSQDFVSQEAARARSDPHLSAFQSLKPIPVECTREEFRKHLESTLKAREFHNVPDRLFKYDEFLGKVLEQLCDNTSLPPGIAKTRAFMENLFCTVVCLDAKIPLIIVGPPGCSKTLSFKIAVDNLKGKSSMKPFYRSLHHIIPYRYQCSEQSTDTEIKSVYKSATTRQSAITSDSDELCAVLLDEVGLPDEKLSPLKILHYRLDHPKVSSVLLSNKILDEAKTNRTLMLLQSEPPTHDLEVLAQGCIYGNNIETVPASTKELLSALCAAYREEVAKLYGSPYPSRFFHLRDFVYFLRYLGKHCASDISGTGMFSLTKSHVFHGLRRNFGGLEGPQFISLVGNFFSKITSVLKRYGQEPWELSQSEIPHTEVDMIKESLGEKLNDDEDPNTAPFRYIMLLDPTENGEAIDLLFDLGLCPRATTSVCYVGDFRGDNDQRVRASVVEKVKTAMVKGETILLVNSASIHSSFYDVFNRHYTVIPTTTNNVTSNLCYANLAAGSFSHPCLVHNNFRVIVHIPKSSLQKIPTPFLNRFEKYTLSIEDALYEYLSKVPIVINEEKQNPFNSLKDSLIETVHQLHVVSSNSHLLYGVEPKETVCSLMLNTVERTFPMCLNMIGTQQDLPPLENNYASYIPQFPPLLGCFPAKDTEAKASQFAAAEHWWQNKQKYIAMANTHILQLARPESIHFLKKKIPSYYLEAYLLWQEHFSLCRFISTLVSKHWEKPHEAADLPAIQQVRCIQKWGIFMRTSAELLKLPNDHQIQEATLSSLREHGIIESGHRMEEYVQVLSLTEMASSQDCADQVRSFCCKPLGCLLICVADLAVVTPNQVNFLRNEINEQWKEYEPQVVVEGVRPSKPQKQRIAIVVLHFPPEIGLRKECCYQAIFLKAWDFTYIDSLGVSSATGAASPIIEADPKTWMAKAFRLEAKLGKDLHQTQISEMNMFKDFFFDLLRQFCTLMHGNGLVGGSGFENQDAQAFYDKDNSKKTPDDVAEMRCNIITSLFEEKPFLYRDIIQRFAQSWTPQFLHALVQQASTTLYRGVSITSFVSILSSSLHTFMTPLLSSTLRMILSSYNLHSVLLMDSKDSELIELVHRIFTTVPIPKMTPEVITNARRVIPMVDICRMHAFPPRLAFYDIVATLVTNKIGHACRSLRDQHRNAQIVFQKVSESIAEDGNLNSILEHIENHPRLFEWFKYDFITRSLKITSLHSSRFEVFCDSNYSKQEIREKLEQFEKLMLNIVQSYKVTLQENIVNLFIVRRFHADEINYFSQLVLPLQLMHPSLSVKDWQVFKVPSFKTVLEMEKWVTKQSAQLLFKRLRGILELQAPEDNNNKKEMISNWGKCYRWFYSSLKPRSELSSLLSTEIETLMQIDAMHVLFLVLLNSDNVFDLSCPFLQNPTTSGLLQAFSGKKNTPAERLREGLKLASQLLPDPPLPHHTQIPHSLESIAEYLLQETPKNSHVMSNDCSDNISIFLEICSDTLPDFDTDKKLKYYCNALTANVGWVSNFLVTWIKTKPQQWREPFFALLASVIAQRPNFNRDTYTTKPDLLSPARISPTFSPLDFYLFHFLTCLMDVTVRRGSDPQNEAKTASQSSLKEVVDYYLQLQSINVWETDVEFILHHHKKTVCQALILKKAAGLLDTSNKRVTLLDQVTGLGEPTLGIISQVLGSNSLTDGKAYFIGALPNDFTALELIRLPKETLQQLNIVEMSTTEDVTLLDTARFSFTLADIPADFAQKRSSITRDKSPQIESSFVELQRTYLKVSTGFQANSLEEVIQQEMSQDNAKQSHLKLCLILGIYYECVLANRQCDSLDSRIKIWRNLLSLSALEVDGIQFIAGLNNFIKNETAVSVYFSDPRTAILLVSVLAIVTSFPADHLLYKQIYNTNSLKGLFNGFPSTALCKDVPRYKLILDIITWGTLCWALILDPTSHQHIQKWFFSGENETPSTGSAIPQTLQASALHNFTDAVSALENDTDTRQMNLDASHYFTESLLFLWQFFCCLHRRVGFTDRERVVEYESTLKALVFGSIDRQYQYLKALYMRNLYSKPKYKALCDMRDTCTGTICSCVFTWEDVQGLLRLSGSCSQGFLAEFIALRHCLRAILKLPRLVHLYKLLNEAFGPHVEAANLHQSVAECITLLAKVDPATADTFKTLFESLIPVWEEIRILVNGLKTHFYPNTKQMLPTATFPPLSLESPFVTLISLRTNDETNGQGDLLFKMVGILVDVQNYLLQLRQEYDTDALNPHSFVFEKSIQHYNIEYLPFSVDKPDTNLSVLINVPSSQVVEQDLIRYITLPPEGSKLNTKIDATQLAIYVIGKYMSGKCLLDKDELRSVFPIGAMTNPQQSAVTIQPGKHGDTIELTFQEEIEKLGTNFEEEIPKSIPLDRALNNEPEDKLRDLVVKLTQLIQRLHRDIQIHPEASEIRRSFSECWTYLMPTHPVPPYLSSHSLKVSHIKSVGRCILAKYKGKQWLFSDLPEEYKMNPVADQRTALESSFSKVLSLSLPERQRLSSVVERMCSFLTKDHLKNDYNKSLLSLFENVKEMNEQYLSDVRALLPKDLKICHYCFFMRNLHTLCGDLLLSVTTGMEEQETEVTQLEMPDGKFPDNLMVSLQDIGTEALSSPENDSVEQPMPPAPIDTTEPLPEESAKPPSMDPEPFEARMTALLQDLEEVVSKSKQEEADFQIYVTSMKGNFNAMKEMLETVKQQLPSESRGLPIFNNVSVLLSKQDDALEEMGLTIDMTKENEETWNQHKRRLDELLYEAHQLSEIAAKKETSSDEVNEIAQRSQLASGVLGEMKALAENQNSAAMEMDTSRNTVEASLMEIQEELERLKLRQQEEERKKLEQEEARKKLEQEAARKKFEQEEERRKLEEQRLAQNFPNRHQRTTSTTTPALPQQCNYIPPQNFTATSNSHRRTTSSTNITQLPQKPMYSNTTSTTIFTANTPPPPYNGQQPYITSPSQPQYQRPAPPCTVPQPTTNPAQMTQQWPPQQPYRQYQPPNPTQFHPSPYPPGRH
ncbi:AAA+ ATPase [Pelomyxa schiedti]|nr:AAA+ ATPase [Pelomyxa schiedti]